MDDYYISRQAAIEKIHSEFDECLVWDESGKHTADEVERILDTIPPADVRPVVFCKDCKHRGYMDNRIPSEKDWVCWMFDVTTKDTDFCSFGEKKE